MHPTQKKILELSTVRNLGELKLREIGELANEPHPQKIKHHLKQLEKRGLLKIVKDKHLIENIKYVSSNLKLRSIPIYGCANCGEAVIFGDEHLEGYLKVSQKLVKSNSEKLFAIKAVGDSMNRANIHGQSIEDGDYVLVDGSQNNPQDQSYVLSIIDGLANIKKFKRNGDQIILASESGQDYPPIIIHKDDLDSYMINGEVVQVIKKPI
ncbi:MAG: S24 family peptidase [bacterium]|nr:S24 family peptidase [bacterium]